MVTERIICHPILGGIRVRFGQRRSGMALRINRDGEVSISVPAHCTFARVETFIEERKEWIMTHRSAIRQRIESARITLPYRTRTCTITSTPATNLHIAQRKGEICIGIPTGEEHSDQTLRVIQEAIIAVFRAEAKVILPQRVAHWASCGGFRVNRVTVRASRTRWGSCSGDNNISLSISLMQLPDRLIDYVILHELCHTVHHDHGPDFHALLNRLTGGRSEELRKELKSYTTLG